VIVFVKVAIVVTFMAHSIACWFVLVSKEDALDANTWLVTFGVSNKPIDEIYITSLYWAFSTMITVGYGDIAPISTNEKLFVIGAMLIACGLFGYSVGSISSVTAKRSELESKFREKGLAIKRFMKNHDVPYRI
jgi:hypothetical protein